MVSGVPPAIGLVDARVEPHRTQVDVVVELEAQPQQQAALEDARRDARVADGAEQDRVVAAELLEHGVRQHLTGGVVAPGPEVVVLGLDLGARRGEGRLEHLEALGDHLGADAVPGDHCESDAGHPSRVRLRLTPRHSASGCRTWSAAGWPTCRRPGLPEGGRADGRTWRTSDQVVLTVSVLADDVRRAPWRSCRGT